MLNCEVLRTSFALGCGLNQTSILSKLKSIIFGSYLVMQRQEIEPHDLQVNPRDHIQFKSIYIFKESDVSD